MSSSKKVFVSYKYKDADVWSAPVSEYTPTEDTAFVYTPRHYVDKLIDLIGSEHIYKGEKSDDDASHLSDESIDSRLKERIFDTSITIVLISPNMWNKLLPEKDQWIPNEIAYSLRLKSRGDKVSHTNGMLAVILPDIKGSYDYAVVQKGCGVRSWQTGSFFKLLRENMFNRKEKNHEWCVNCLGYHHYNNDHSYIHPIKWHDFVADYNRYIEHAVSLRERKHEFDITKVH